MAGDTRNESYPYYEWLEEVMKEMADGDVRAISIETVDKEGQVSSSFWNVNRGDRALMMAAMQEAQVMDTIADNRDILMQILEMDDDDEECCDEC